jgi:hypothetical protein
MVASSIVGVAVAIIIGVVVVIGMAVAGNVRKSAVVWITTEIRVARNTTFV